MYSFYFTLCHLNYFFYFRHIHAHIMLIDITL
nr:MAG TPA: hypothetical protein [Bacteriophage sp.]